MALEIRDTCPKKATKKYQNIQNITLKFKFFDNLKIQVLII